MDQYIWPLVKRLWLNALLIGLCAGVFVSLNPIILTGTTLSRIPLVYGSVLCGVVNALLILALYRGLFWSPDRWFTDLGGPFSTAVALIATIITVMYFITRDGFERSLAVTQWPATFWTVATPHIDAKILSRLPPQKKGKLLQIEAQRKHTRITTSQGSHILRMTFKQAVDEAQSEAGAVVHRSHWISFDEIERLYYEDGNPKVRMSNGHIVPISRKSVPLLKEKSKALSKIAS